MVFPKRCIPFIFIVFALLLPAMPAAAQDDIVTDDEVNEVARDIYCPVCENTPLDVCQTQACADWRELIREKLAGGQSEQQIFDYFARQYGDGVLANPPGRGLSLVILWVLPAALLLVGLLFFARYMRGLRSVESEAVLAGAETRLDAGSAASSPPANDYLARIEQELEKNNE